MKILIIHNRYQYRGGEDTEAEQEIELLKKKHSVEVLCFQNQKGFKGAFQFFCSIWNIYTVKKVKQKIHEFQPDLVHVHNWHFAVGPLVFRTINRLGIPVLHTVQNYRLLCPSALLLHKGELFTDSLSQVFPWKAVRNRVYRSSVIQTFWLAFIVWFHKRIGTWKKIDSYLCLTPFAVELFQQSNFGVPKEKFFVKPNFTIVTEVQQRLEKENYFLFIGRLSEEKGLKTLLDVFKELPFELKIAGDGPLKDTITQTTMQFDNITYLGNLTKNEVAAALSKAQALVFPSIWYEGMPLTILESYSHGTPIIASNLGAMTSMIINNHNGLHFMPGNTNDLKNTVLKFDALSSSKKKQMRINALESYQTTYSPELQLRYFDTIYNAF